jgi:hypothetical protein
VAEKSKDPILHLDKPGTYTIQYHGTAHQPNLTAKQLDMQGTDYLMGGSQRQVQVNEL